jgi:SAM-dependent methyltransferase
MRSLNRPCHNRLFGGISNKYSMAMAALRSSVTKKFTRGRLDVFVASHASNELVLDIGCGNSPYAKYFPDRIALDVVKRDVKLDAVGDVSHLPFKATSFSKVLATEVLEHVKDPQRAIDEMERVLKPGGSLVLTTRFVFPLHDAPYDFYRFTKYGLRHLFRNWAGLKIMHEAGSFETIAILLQRITFQCDFYGSKIVKTFLLLIAHLVKFGGKCGALLVKAQYGDGMRHAKEDEMMTSGYYVVASKSLDESKST